MARRNPRAGDRYRFTAESIGNDNGRVVTGTIVTIREVVGADTIGAGDDRSDSVVVEWDAPALGTADDGTPTIIHAPRSWSVPADDFGDLFEKVKD